MRTRVRIDSHWVGCHMKLFAWLWQSTISRNRAAVPALVGFCLVVFSCLFNHFVLYEQRIPLLSLPLRELIHSSPINRGHFEKDEYELSFSISRICAGLARLIRAMDNTFTDQMFRMNTDQDANRSRLRQDGRVVIVDIDDASIDQLGQWPWSRKVLASLIDRMRDAKARVIGFDVVFAEADRSSPKFYVDVLNAANLLREKGISPDDESLDNDRIFARAVSSTPVVLGFHLFNGKPKEDDIAPEQGTVSWTARQPNGDQAPLDELALPEANRATINLPMLYDFSPGPMGEGFFNIFPDESGMVRTVPLFMYLTQPNPLLMKEMPRILLPALSLEMIRVGERAFDYTIYLTGRVNDPLPGSTRTGAKKAYQYQISHVEIANSKDPSGQALMIPVNEEGELTIKYRGRTSTFPYIPAWEVLDGQHADMLRDKYVLVGSSAGGLLDLRANMFDVVYPGIEAHANVIDNILQNDFIHNSYRANYVRQQAMIIGAGLFLVAATAFLSPLKGMAVGLLVLVTMTGVNYLLFFRRGYIVGVTMPFLSCLCVVAVEGIAGYLLLGRERRFIRNAFSLSVSPSLLSYLESHPERLTSLAGEQREMTVLFTDIRGFTAMSEAMDAREVASFLNEYLTPMSEIVLQTGGTVDKFIGDAVMAFWNAPADDPDHAKSGARAVLAMLAKVEELQPSWTKRGLPVIEIGCGLNTGPMFAGYMGSERRKNYTVMGDNVNLASRLEGLTKIYNAGCIISASTRAAIGNTFSCRLLDKVRVVGRLEPVLIYDLLGENLMDESILMESSEFARMFSLYQAREFELADMLLSELISLHPEGVPPLYELYKNRLAIYKAIAPPKEWDGVFVATDK